MKRTCFILLGLMMAATSWGRLGETPDSCDIRYGKPVAEKGAEGCWTISREYKTSAFTVSVRFITLSTGAKVAGWIKYTSMDPKNSAILHSKMRAIVSHAWKPLAETTITQNMPLHMQQISKVHNAHVAELQATIQKVAGEFLRCWMSPTAYAAETDTTLVMFSDVYLERNDAKKVPGGP